jgi:hypothetical protein
VLKEKRKTILKSSSIGNRKPLQTIPGKRVEEP